MQKIKKLFSLGLSAALLGLALRAPSGAVEGASVRPHEPGSLGVHENLEFYGTKPKRLVQTTAATLLWTGEGFLDAICAFGGTSGKYAMAFDSGIASSQGPTVESLSLAISPYVFTFTQDDTTDGRIAASCELGCWCPPKPVKFVNGLVGRSNDAGHAALYYVHSSTGANPTP